MTSRYQQKLPDESELEQKTAELASLRARLADARAVLQQLRSEISRFERDYNQTLGRRIAELERIEAEIARLTGYAGDDSQWEDESYSAGGARFQQEKAAKPPQQTWKTPEAELKSLYREVAKAIHPDLAGSASSKLARHELMSKANRAYEEDDRRTLQEILRIWRRAPVQPEVNSIAAELARVARLIARERQEILSVDAQVEELRKSYVCRFKLRVDQNLAMGSDLFAEMIAATELNINRARKRLALLRGESSYQAPHRPQVPKREVVFPADISCGTLYQRDRNSLDYSRWKKLGPARGRLDIDVDQALRLDVKEQAAAKLERLKTLRTNDLQSLYLYEVADVDIAGILHLTGLEELYLYGPRLTDAALSGISSLVNLKRIYLYQTAVSDLGLFHLQRLPSLSGLTSSGNSITDEGLAIFQKAIPGVKTVSFPWKYQR
jgi:hypothetical protein